MKLVKAGALTALAGFAFVACSGGQTEQSGGDSKVGFNLLANDLVDIQSVEYDLNTSSGTDVKNGSIPVPNDDSVINGFVGELAAGSYSLSFSATGTYNGEPVSCSSDPRAFTLEDGETEVLDDVVLTCEISVDVEGARGNVSFAVGVEVDQIQVIRDVIETFVVAPTTATTSIVGTECVWAPISVDISNTNPDISYSWSSTPDGGFTLNASNTQGTYDCSSAGTKTLTVSASLNGVDASASVDVVCGECGNICGNGIVEPGEECDDAGPSETCDADCNIIVPNLCGNGAIDPGEQCDPPDGVSCDANCQTIVGDACGECVSSCETCVDSNPDLADFDNSLCDGSPNCVAVQECVLRSGCFDNGVPGECYCGANDIDTCSQDGFDPQTNGGPCVDEIIAAAGNAPNNSELLARYFDYNYDLGVAMLVMDEAINRVCVSDCACTSACQ